MSNLNELILFKEAWNILFRVKIRIDVLINCKNAEDVMITWLNNFSFQKNLSFIMNNLDQMTKFLESVRKNFRCLCCHKKYQIRIIINGLLRGPNSYNFQFLYKPRRLPFMTLQNFCNVPKKFARMQVQSAFNYDYHSRLFS